MNARRVVEVKSVGLVNSVKTIIDIGEQGVEDGAEVSSWSS